jgi:hypothetical protein
MHGDHAETRGATHMNFANFLFWADIYLDAACVAVFLAAWLYETVRGQRAKLERRLRQSEPVRVTLSAPWLNGGE